MLATRAGLSGLATMCAGEEKKAAASSDNLVMTGHDFVLEVCAACHVVAKDQKSAPILKPPAPSLLVIARRPKTTKSFLRHFLSSPHGKMPDPQLAEFQIDEVVAYMLNLKRRN
jgi:mono/diheme cytochrome c family protein